MSDTGIERPYNELAPAEIWRKALKDAGSQLKYTPESLMKMVQRGSQIIPSWEDVQRRALEYACDRIRAQKPEDTKISIQEVASVLGISRGSARALLEERSSFSRVSNIRPLLRRYSERPFKDERDFRFMEVVLELADKEGGVESQILAQKLGIKMGTINKYWARLGLHDKGYILLRRQGRVQQQLTRAKVSMVNSPLIEDQIREVTNIRLARAEEAAQLLKLELGRLPSLQELAERAPSPERSIDVKIHAMRILLGRNPETAKRIFGNAWEDVLRG